MRSARLWERNTGKVVSAELILEITPEHLVETEKHWKVFRSQAQERHMTEGSAIPEHNHWDWDEKSYDLKFTAYRCLGIQHDDDMQGLMMVSTLAAPGRSEKHKGKPVLYIKYIESAPWNLKDYAGMDARFGGIGVSFIRAAIEVSVEEEFRGRIALHSLPQSEPFYLKFMEDLGIDPDVEKLRYFEMGEQNAIEFLKGGEG